MPTLPDEETYDAAREVLGRHGFSDYRDLIDVVADFITDATSTTERMDPEVKQRWVDALRYDDYTQGAGVLRTVDDEFCCLGVLCNLIDRDGWAEPDPHSQERYGTRSMAHDPVTMAVTVPGSAVYAEAIGQPIIDPANPPRIVLAIQQLAGVNDGGGTFPLIADLIEEYL